MRHHTLLSCKSILAIVTLICHQVYFVNYGIILKLLILKQLKSSSCNTTSQFWKNMMLSCNNTFSLIQNKQSSCFLMRFGISHQLLTLIYVTHVYMLSPKCCICLQNYEINIFSYCHRNIASLSKMQFYTQNILVVLNICKNK